MRELLNPARVVSLAALVALLVVLGLLTNGLTVGIVAAVLLLVAAGFIIGHLVLFADRTELQAQRQVLGTEWQALEQTRRVRSVFLAARRAMQDEARRHRAGQ